MRDLAAAAWRQGRGPVRAAVVATDADQLAERLAAARGALADPAGRADAAKVADGVFVAADGGASPRVAFLFPGQGSQRPGMLAPLFVAFPGLQRHLRRGERFLDVMFPPMALDADGRKAQAAAITDTRLAQPTLGMADLAVADLLGSLGVWPDMAGGHSYGELVALCVAGAIDEADLVELSVARAEAILGAAGDDPGAMAAVAADAAAVREALGRGSETAGSVVVANDNSPTQVVISGRTDAVDAAVAVLGEAGLAAKRLPVACAFHSPVVAEGADEFGEVLRQHRLGTPAFPVWSNVTAEPYGNGSEAVRTGLAAQLASPVRFREQVESMYAAGARVFVEAGPGKVLTGLVSRILAGRPHVAVATDPAGKGDLEGLLLAVAQLSTQGVPVDARFLFDGRAKPLDLAGAPPAAAGWLVNGHLVRTAAGDVVDGALRPATDVPVVTMPAGQPVQSSAVAAGGGPDPREAVVLEYLRAVREVVAAGREIMLGYLNTPGTPPAGWAPGAVPLAGPAPLVAGEPLFGAVAAAPAYAAAVEAAAAPEVAPAPAAGPSRPSRQALHQIVVTVVSDRTGYPVDMLEPGLDLEADLSIDSIKRLEIVGELAERVGLATDAGGAVDESVVEELVAVKTLSGVVDWLDNALGAGDDTSPAPVDAGPVDAGPVDAGPVGVASVAVAPVAETTPFAVVAGDAPAINGAGPATNGHAAANGHVTALVEDDGGLEATVPERAMRFVPVLVDVDRPAHGSASLAGKRVAVTDDGNGIAAALVSELGARGAEARVLADDEGLGGVDVLVHLAGLAQGIEGGALRLLDLVQQALADGVGTVVAATAMGGTFGTGGPGSRFPRQAGMRGVLKTLAREADGVRVRVVDLDPAVSVEEAAAALAEEIGDPEGPVEVGRADGRRRAVTVTERALDGVRSAPVLDASSVVLVTGGARGVTARVAVALAERYRCRIVLAGRTPAPPTQAPGADVDDELEAARELVDLRRLLAGRRFGAPAAIEAECRHILADRQVRQTLAALAALGVDAEYHQLDVRDPSAVRTLVDDLYERHGRLDAVVHGAGVLEDARIADKTAESFRRVFDTKVAGALALAASLRPDVKAVVFFGSVSGIFGNKGQVDYAAANDALAAIGRWLDGRVEGRVVTIDWGPWGGGGMVSAELEREFARRGVGMLDPEDALSAILGELESDAGDTEVIVMRALPERFGFVSGSGSASASASASGSGSGSGSGSVVGGAGVAAGAADGGDA